MSDNDTAQEILHESNAVLAMRLVLLQLMLAVLSAVLTVTYFYLISDTTNTTLLATLVVITNIIVFLFDAFILVATVLRWKNTTYSISPELITVRNKGPKEHAKIYNTRDIEEVEVDQSPLGRTLDYGTVSFSAPGLDSRVELTNIPHPWQYANMLSHRSQEPH